MSTEILITVNAIGGGGAEKAAIIVAEELSLRNMNVHICALNRSSEAVDVDISLKTSTLSREWGNGALSTLKSLVEFSKVLKKENPDTIVAHCELPELFVALIAPPKCKIFVVEHTTNPWANRKWLGRLVRTILFLRKCTWVSVVQDEKSIWFGPREPIRISNPLRVVHSNNVSGAPSLVFAGRLRREKRPEWALRAAVENQVPIMVFGEGDARAALEKEFNVHQNLVSFKGFTPDLWKLVPARSLVIVPSEYEGDGLVVVEAMVNGHMILLADNSDLRRFGLPNENYFMDFRELCGKVAEWKTAHAETFKVPADIVNQQISRRNPDTISNAWESLLKSNRE